jgi:exonuclease VII small subunit
MKRLSATTRKMTQGFLSLSQRERVILSLAAVALLFVAGQEVASSVENSIDETRRQVQVRTQQLKDLERALTRYTSLKQRRDTLQASFAQSQMSFEQVTNELDRIVRTAIGSDNYELKKPNPPYTVRI